MEKWDVFLILSSVITFVATIVKPIINLTNTISILNIEIKQLKSVIIEINNKSEYEKKLIWNHNKKQDMKIQDQEYRIEILEGGRNESKKGNYN